MVKYMLGMGMNRFCLTNISDRGTIVPSIYLTTKWSVWDWGVRRGNWSFPSIKRYQKCPLLVLCVSSRFCSNKVRRCSYPLTSVIKIRLICLEAICNYYNTTILLAEIIRNTSDNLYWDSWTLRLSLVRHISIFYRSFDVIIVWWRDISQSVRRNKCS